METSMTVKEAAQLLGKTETKIEILKRMYESDAYISKRQLSMVFGWSYEGKEK